MKTTLLLLTLTLLTPSTQAQDVNAHLGIPEKVIGFICGRAGHLSTALYNGVVDLTSFEEALYVAAGKKPLLGELDSQNLPLPYESQVEIGKLWNEKYNQIFCPMGSSFVPEGYIEFKLLMSGQTNAFWSLYEPTNGYNININRLLKKNPWKSDEEAEWVTLADLLKHYIENPVGQMTQREGLRELFASVYNTITTKYGAKHASELMPLLKGIETTKAQLAKAPNNVELNFKLANQLIEIRHPNRIAQYDKAFALLKQQGRNTFNDQFYYDEVVLLSINYHSIFKQQFYELIDFIYTPNSKMGFVHYFKGFRVMKDYKQGVDYKQTVKNAKQREKDAMPYFKKAEQLGYGDVKTMLRYNGGYPILNNNQFNK